MYVPGPVLEGLWEALQKCGSGLAYPSWKRFGTLKPLSQWAPWQLRSLGIKHYKV